MRYAQNLYIGESLTNVEHIKKLLAKRIYVYGVYLLCVNVGSANLLEIFSCNEVFKTVNRNKDYLVIGITEGKKEAFLLFKKIVEDFVAKDNDISHIKDFLSAAKKPTQRNML